MDLKDCLSKDQTLMLSADTKAAALATLADALCNAAPELDKAVLMDAIIKREEMMSTGIGQGLGIPHVRLAGLNRPVMAVGITRQGLADYESLDNNPVYVIVMIAAPQGQHEVYIRLLARVAEVLKQSDVRQKIIESDDPEEVRALLCGED